MDKMILTCPCNFGVESVLKRELQFAGLEIKQVDDGRIDFYGNENDIALGNIRLRSAERVLLKLASFPATSFEELYQGVKAIDWAAYLPADACFPASKAASRKSTLFSVSDIQSITKKAAVDKMFTQYRQRSFPETGEKYPINIFVNKDIVNIYLDTTGEPLFKRGYRQETNIAPIKETLAYALTALSGWRYHQLLIDPLCGSGTILIEAALAAMAMAPGLNRNFLAEKWGFMAADVWKLARDEAASMRREDEDFRVFGYDIDEHVLRAARHNAQAAGVEKYIHFQQRDVRELSAKEKGGRIITNPPYGERMSEKTEARQLYAQMGEVFNRMDGFSAGIITADDTFEQCYGRKADKRRKLYNGMIKCTYYQYF